MYMYSELGYEYSTIGRRERRRGGERDERDERDLLTNRIIQEPHTLLKP
jgi:hypothetical protein